ncbi:hypothetical protein [Streptococcus mutans]|uniref:hypothetical protein n=1 Tax=Streptococcus mutans TaxID=1309 RepID=UPI000B547FDD|nr:hypothetical protein [Streptococcus mutans]MDW5564905.1 hypothetical protein [Streptococcus mutans]
MKIKTFILSSLLGAGLYQMYYKRKDIKTSFKESKTHYDKAKFDLNNIKENLAIIKQQKEKIQAINQDLTYKIRVFQKESQSHMDEIQKIVAKYHQED